MSARLAVALLLAASLAACRSRSSPSPSPSASPSASSNTPMLSFSQRQQPTRPGGRGAPTDGREYEQGKRFHLIAKPLCGSDRGCMFRKCSELCADWTRGGRDGGKLSPVTLNQIYFNCTGSCWEPDAGP